MRKLFLIGFSLLHFGCGQATTPEIEQFARKVNLRTLFTYADAIAILGEPGHLKDSSSFKTKEVFIYKLSFIAESPDELSGKTGIIYYMIEEYTKSSTAQKKYAEIYEGNKNHGVKVLTGVGDEAYFHTDNENFYFILARKGARMIRMKVNKVTSKTSLEKFNAVGERIAAAL
jgi:hypothetical protein